MVRYNMNHQLAVQWEAYHAGVDNERLCLPFHAVGDTSCTRASHAGGVGARRRGDSHVRQGV